MTSITEMHGTMNIKKEWYICVFYICQNTSGWQTININVPFITINIFNYKWGWILNVAEYTILLMFPGAKFVYSIYVKTLRDGKQ